MLICGNQVDDGIGLVVNLYQLNATEYAHSKDLIKSTVAAPPKRVEILKMDMLLSGNESSYDLRLENVCLNECLSDSQSLNNVCSFCLFIDPFVVFCVFFCLRDLLVLVFVLR